MTKSNRTGEAIMQQAVLETLDRLPKGQATIEQLIAEIPKHIKLTSDDLAPSKTRAGEAVWEQIVRNIRSHANTSTNYIYQGYIEEFEGGYRITNTGRKKVNP